MSTSGLSIIRLKDFFSFARKGKTLAKQSTLGTSSTQVGSTLGEISTYEVSDAEKCPLGSVQQARKSGQSPTISVYAKVQLPVFGPRRPLEEKLGHGLIILTLA